MFAGIWNLKGSKSILRIDGPLGGDRYSFILDDSEPESVGIFISNEAHALLTNSKHFGRSDITIINANNNKIGSYLLERQ